MISNIILLHLLPSDKVEGSTQIKAPITILRGLLLE